MSSMSDKKLLVVIVATGTQGGSVINTFIGFRNGPFECSPGTQPAPKLES